ncbi:hypothetical protein Pfo_013814 [Paulownia fortunei]|nr:hypothetical protein Pfo_013814 [Paulownia fortunei]
MKIEKRQERMIIIRFKKYFKSDLFLHIADAVNNHNYLQRRDVVGRLGFSTNQKITAASPTANDVARLLHIGKQRSFPGILSRLDCMHWRSLEMTCIFGMSGSNNDINILDASHLFSNLAKGIAPPVNYVIQGKEYNMGYYLADGIYQNEAYRKDVERVFEVLQSRFAIEAALTHFWRKSDLHDIMTTCIIIHNMIVENEYNLDAPIQDAMEAPTSNVEMVVDENIRFQEFLAWYRQIKDKETHIALQNALIDHLWDEYTNLKN